MQRQSRISNCICSRSLTSFYNFTYSNLLCIGTVSALELQIPLKKTFRMPPIPVEVHTKGKPWPGYFLVRSTGEVVPLIAVDELPPNIELVGVPRSLDLAETIGMLNLGLQRSTGGFYQFTQGEESRTGGSEEVGKAK
jgi:hypothetical protein